MDTNAILAELRSQRQQLEEAIMALERVQMGSGKISHAGKYAGAAGRLPKTAINNE